MFHRKSEMIHDIKSNLRGGVGDLDFCNLPPLDMAYFEKVGAHVRKYVELLEQTDMRCDDAALLKDEYRLNMRLLMHGVMLGKYKLLGHTDREKAWELLDDIETIIADYRALWLKRNKNINLENSMFKFYELRRQYIEHLDLYRVKV